MKDALASEDLKLTGSLIVALGSAGTLEVGASEVGAAEIGSEAVTSTKHTLIATGSPPAYGRTILTGNAVLPAGVGSDWIVFGNTFLAAPDLTITPQHGQAIGAWAAAGSAVAGFSIVDTGSFLAMGSPTGSIMWLAAGSGQI